VKQGIELQFKRPAFDNDIVWWWSIPDVVLMVHIIFPVDRDIDMERLRLATLDPPPDTDEYR
jgi:hypothetical protein